MPPKEKRAPPPEKRAPGTFQSGGKRPSLDGKTGPKITVIATAPRPGVEVSRSPARYTAWALALTERMSVRADRDVEE